MDNPPLAVEEPYDTSWVAAFLAGSALGAVADGFVVAMALYQVFAFRLDAVRPLYRRVIGITAVFLTAHMTSLVADVIYTFGTHYGNVGLLDSVSVPYGLSEILGGWVASLVQGVYAYRAWYLLGQHRWLAIPLVPIVLLTAASWTYAGISHINRTDETGYTDFARTQMGYVAAVVADSVVMSLMLIGLYRARGSSASSTHRASRLVTKIALVTVSSNALTCAVCIYQFVNSFKQNAAWQILDQLIPSLYLLSLLCWLLIRRYLSDHHGTQNSASAAQTEIWTGCDACGTHASALRQTMRLPRLGRDTARLGLTSEELDDGSDWKAPSPVPPPMMSLATRRVVIDLERAHPVAR